MMSQESSKFHFDEHQLRRLHPATFIIEFARAIGRLLWAIIFVVAMQFMGDGGDTNEVLFAAIGLFGGVAALVRYWTTSYAVVNEHLVIKSGVFQKQVRTIPIDKVQDIQLVRNVLHRILGITDLKIQTAAGTGVEGDLSAVSLKEADRLRFEILGSHAGVRESHSAAGFVGPGLAPIPVQKEHPKVYHAKISDLALLGSTENRLFAMLAVATGFFTFGSQFEMKRLVRVIERGFGADVTPLWMMIGLFVAALLVGWIGAILTSIIGYYNYTVRSSGEQLTRNYGLLTQHENNIPLKRIQAIRLRGTWLSMAIGFCQIQVRSAGSSELTGEHVMFPIVRLKQVPEVIPHLFPNVDLDAVEWQSISPKAIRRGFWLHFWPGLILIAVAHLTSLFAGMHNNQTLWFEVGALAAWALACFPLAKARYRRAQYGIRDEFFFIRSGVFSRQTMIIPMGKIQTVDLTQSFFQRRAGLASVNVVTAGSLGVAVIWDLPYADALDLAERLSEENSKSKYFLLDGV